MKKLSILFVVLVSAFTLSAQDLEVNINKSKLKWTGKKVSGEHWGYVKLKNGFISIKDNKIIKGEFQIDMNSITCNDLENPEWNAKLIGHLKSDDFFSVNQHPIAVLKITDGTPFISSKSKLQGQLSIKGITHPISFEVKKTDKAYKATIIVDRTKYDVKYGSGKFFDNLGDNMIDDDFILEVEIITK